MKLELLRYVARQIARDLDAGATLCVYYFFESEWNQLDHQGPVPTGEARSLELAKSSDLAHRPRGSSEAWFFIKELDSVVAIKFLSAPTTLKQKEIKKHIDLANERAGYLFRADHNPLTLLLAKDAFHKELADAIDTAKIVDVNNAIDEENAQSHQLSVLALDIDYFKQINDTYGHLYGDQVLKTFGRRLEAAAAEIVRTTSNRISVLLGHPSGEEFLVLITGTCSREEIISWAEVFRAKIDNEILPTQDEWERLNAVSNLAAIPLPPQQDRAVRASIGVTFRSVENASESGFDEAKFLLERADTALYRAKSGGRNQVVEFEDILSSCGRVLEQDNQTRIVAIDIGSNVGVVKGQEFKVFSPNFTGTQRLLINDGRTVRTLGMYPRIELTRVTVFDVQPEVSFAFVTLPEDKTLEVAKGSHLEAIPVGSVGHIATYKTKYFVAGSDAAAKNDIYSLKTYLKDEVERKHKVFSTVFRFVNEKEFLRKYGSAALNIGITQLYRDILSGSRSHSLVAVLDEASVGIVGMHNAYREDVIERIVDSFYKDFPELGLTAGVFCHDDISLEKDDLETDLDPVNGVEFAQFAASQYGREAGSKITHFGRKVAVRLLSNQRAARAYSSGQADYEKLIDLGVVDAEIRNEGGLLYSAAGQKILAAEQYEAAIAIKPNTIVYHSNLAMALKAAGEQDRALKVLNALTNEQFLRLIKVIPFAALNYAVMLAKAKDKGGQNYNEGRFGTLSKKVNEYDPEFKSKRKLDYQLINSAAENL